MTQLTKRLDLILLIMLCMVTPPLYPAADATAINDGLNRVRLETPDGGKRALGTYIGQGKWVVLNIWGTRCPPCREEVPELVRFHDEHQEDDAIVVGIAIDFPSYGYAKKQEVIDFAEDYFIDFPLLLSNAGITEKIGLGRLEGLPTTYVFTPDGKIAGMQVGGITKKILEDFINNMSKEKQEAAEKTN